jgi:hypothetical protein
MARRAMPTWCRRTRRTPIYDRIREFRAELAATSCARERAQAEEELKSLVAERGQVRLRVRRRGETPPNVVIQVGPTRCSPHAPTSPRPLATSRISSSCAGPRPARKETRTLRHCGWHGLWERPDNGFADRVLATAAKREHLNRRRRSQLVTASHITQHGAGDGSIPHAAR